METPSAVRIGNVGFSGLRLGEAQKIHDLDSMKRSVEYTQV